MKPTKNNIFIDPNAGFCTGVNRAITLSEITAANNNVYTLGELVHNEIELERLSKLGIKVIDFANIETIINSKLIIRAHGEPPPIYNFLKNKNIDFTDATCPVVLKLQQKVKLAAEEMQKLDGYLLIFGKKYHPEIIGLLGNSLSKAIAFTEIDELLNLNFTKPIRLFTQTTSNENKFKAIINDVKNLIKKSGGDISNFKVLNNVCSQMSKRAPAVKKFAKKHSIIVFVSGKNSSNGQYLYSICKNNNHFSYLISSLNDIDKIWFENSETIGITGATSTPLWLLNKTKEFIIELLNVS